MSRWDNETRQAIGAAIDAAIYPPLKGRAATAQVPWQRIERLRETLEALGIDWRRAKVQDDANRAEARERGTAEHRAEWRARADAEREAS